MKETDGNQCENLPSTHNSTMAAISLFHTTQCIAIIYYYCKYSSMFARLLSVLSWYGYHQRENTGSRLFTEVKPCWTELISGWVTIAINTLCCTPWEVRLA